MKLQCVRRLEGRQIKDKFNIEDQLERVHSVTKIVQARYKANLNLRNHYAKEILARSTVIVLRHGTETMHFRPKGSDGQLVSKGVLMLCRRKTLVLQYSKAIGLQVALEQYREIIR